MLAPRLRVAAVAGALTLPWTVPDGAVAQAGCEFGDEGNDETFVETVPGGRITYISNPHFLCDGGVQIWADSAVAYSADAFSHFMGAVRYVEGSREMRADDARYFSNVGRLQAQGNVSIVDSVDGSGIENGDLVYLRVTDFRDVEEMTVTTGADGVRPRATVRRSPPADSSAVVAEVNVEPDVDADLEATVEPEAVPGAEVEPQMDAEAGAEVEPYTVVADRIDIRGGSHLTALGDVVIERDSLFAYADSAEYDGGTDELLLERSARVRSAAYDLVGRTITMATLDASTDELRALGDAVLTGDDLELTAPLIVAHLRDGAVQRLVGIPTGEEALSEADSVRAPRPVALAQQFELTADSLELTSAQGVFERILGAGAARSVSRARDSLNVEALPEAARTDWLEGDTIIVTLEPLPVEAVEARTGGAEYEVERIVARVGARSLYRLPPSDTTAQLGVDAPAVHYVMGDEITIHMNAGEVERMEVSGQTRGIHLEPLRATPADTLTDSTTVRPDTIATGDGDPPAGARDGPPTPIPPPARPEPGRRP